MCSLDFDNVITDSNLQTVHRLLSDDLKCYLWKIVIRFKATYHHYLICIDYTEDMHLSCDPA